MSGPWHGPQRKLHLDQLARVKQPLRIVEVAHVCGEQALAIDDPHQAGERRAVIERYLDLLHSVESFSNAAH
jgi:hypothetical protein